MEKQLLDNINGADMVGDNAWTYYGPTLKVDIGPHKAGEQFVSVTIDVEAGVIELYDNEEGNPCFKGKLEFKLPIEAVVA